jgi:hypothetical protein
MELLGFFFNLVCAKLCIFEICVTTCPYEKKNYIIKYIYGCLIFFVLIIKYFLFIFYILKLSFGWI